MPMLSLPTTNPPLLPGRCVRLEYEAVARAGRGDSGGRGDGVLVEAGEPLVVLVLRAAAVVGELRECVVV